MCYLQKVLLDRGDRLRARSALKRCTGLGRLWAPLLILALVPAGTEARADANLTEVGNFYLQNFGPDDYDGHPQNWAVVQAPDGLVYVANNNGVLEYDGVSWRSIPMPNRSVVRSLAVGAGGRVFVGAEDELGYLEADSQGRMRYVSLLDRLAAEERSFAFVWNAVATSEGVYFLTYERLFRWDGQEMKVWRADTRFHTCFAPGGVLHVRQRDVGLMRMEDDSLVLAPGGSLFRDKLVYGLVPSGDGELVAITRQHGMFRCPGAPTATADRGPADRGPACTPFAAGLKERLVALQPYHATRTPAGILAIATLRGGLLLLDADGHLLRVLDKAAGLRNETVGDAHLDRQGGLWLALNNGLARVELGSPLSYWDETLGLRGAVNDTVRHEGRLYAATNLGVYRLAPSEEGAAPRFEPVSRLASNCFSLVSTPAGLLAGCDGLYDVEHWQQLWNDSVVFSAVLGGGPDPVVYLGLRDGLARMRLRDGQWGDVERIDGVHSEISSIVEDAAGRLWLGSLIGGIMRVDLPNSQSEDLVASDVVVTRFGEADGLPAEAAGVLPVGGRVVVWPWFEHGSQMFFRLDAEADPTVFVPDTPLSSLVPGDSFRRLAEDAQGRVWFAAGAHSGVASPAAGGGYTWQPTALRRAHARNIYRMYAEPGGPLWIGGPHGLVRHDTKDPLDTSRNDPVRIRHVATSTGSLIHGGGGAAQPSAELPYRDNSLRFAFAALRFNAPEQTRYRVRLDGRDDAWSAWTDETYKDYTDLWEGRYVFRVQARDVYGIISREDRFAFRILPPWWRRWWAYGGYMLLFAGAIVAVYRSAYHVQQRKLEREQQINRQLREVDKLKDEFLAATSHELRTPLYGITGLAESLVEGAGGEMSAEARQNLNMIVASGRRLSRLVDDILDFSKLRRASLALDRQPVDLRALVDIVLTLSRPLVADKDLELVNAVAVELPPALADENRVQQVLHNLVGNAIKFTEAGRVEVSARVDGGRLVVEVSDTGIGIPEEHRERIFAAFEQADSSLQRRFGGTGLGLAVSRQLVELHGGELWLESTSRVGSTFLFTLSMADEAAAAAPIETAPVEVLAAEESPVEPAAGAAPQPAGTAAEANGDPARILVVDDEPVNRRVLAGQLEAAGYCIVSAADGPEALRRLEEQRFDLVLLDIMMPRMSGYEVCRTLRQHHPAQDLPVLFLTAKARLEDQVSGLAEGANDFLTKPVPRDALLARVRTHVELLEAHRKQLAGLLPICAQCKNIRDDKGYWERIETYFAGRSELSFSHGICPDCYKQLYEEKLGPMVEGEA